MKDLAVFIKDEFMKKALFEEGLYIDNIDDTDKIASKINTGESYNLIFKNSGLKERFFDIISTIRPDSTVINCNCSVDTFNSFNINNINGLIIFNNIKKCKHSEIIEAIKKYKGILIC